MKCTNYIATETYGKKYPKTRIVPTRPYWTRTRHPNDKRNLSPWTPCPGTLKIHLKVVNEPVHGGTDAKLDLRFICSHCGDFGFVGVGLPSEYDFAEWVQALMDKVEATEFKDSQSLREELDDQRNAMQAEMMAKGMSAEESFAKASFIQMKAAEKKFREKMKK